MSTPSVSTAATPLPSAQAHHRPRSRFYGAMSAAMLAVVLVGFAPSFYLRRAFASPEVTPAVWVHGAVLTLWFAGLFAQSQLVATQRAALHRKLGWLVAAIGVGAILTSVFVTLAAVAAHSIMPRTVWSNLTNATAFAVFLGAAIACRTDGEAHKRLMLLASIAFVQPAVARIARWPPLNELGPPLLTAMFASLLFVVAMVAYDLATRRHVHRATLLGGAGLLFARLVAVFVLANSTWGRALFA